MEKEEGQPLISVLEDHGHEGDHHDHDHEHEHDHDHDHDDEDHHHDDDEDEVVDPMNELELPVRQESRGVFDYPTCFLYNILIFLGGVWPSMWRNHRSLSFVQIVYCFIIFSLSGVACLFTATFHILVLPIYFFVVFHYIYYILYHETLESTLNAVLTAASRLETHRLDAEKKITVFSIVCVIFFLLFFLPSPFLIQTLAPYAPSYLSPFFIITWYLFGVILTLIWPLCCYTYSLSLGLLRDKLTDYHKGIETTVTDHQMAILLDVHRSLSNRVVDDTGTLKWGGILGLVALLSFVYLPLVSIMTQEGGIWKVESLAWLGIWLLHIIPLLVPAGMVNAYHEEVTDIAARLFLKADQDSKKNVRPLLLYLSTSDIRVRIFGVPITYSTTSILLFVVIIATSLMIAPEVGFSEIIKKNY